MNRKQRRALGKKKMSPDRLIVLGKAAHKQGRLEEAERCYRSVLGTWPNHPDALHFLGILLHRHGDSRAGIEMVNRSLAIDPQNVHTLNNLGNIHKEIGELEGAARCYRKVLERHPDHADALNNLGVILKIHGDYDNALETFGKALKQAPENPDIHQNLSNCYRKMGRFDEAIDCYWKAIHLRPYEEEEYSYLRQILYASGQGQKVFKLIEEWLERDPGNVSALHLRATFNPDIVPERANDGYVRKTFDNFANSFDSVLKSLDYRAPELVSALINSRFSASLHKPEVLDAGCGTGLCGPLIKASVARLDGVDISPGMLEKASQRSAYDHLFEAELTGFIAALSEAYDAILSADTLVYFGDLKPVFKAAFGALRPGGVFVFTVEKSVHERDFELQPHGRYCHSGDYLRSTLEASGFSILSCDSVILRRELGEDVQGLLIEALVSKDQTPIRDTPM
ncbi:MAG: tetratricopeptide repeat protein [Methylococcaceae bacterium]|nr:tetratricopeptide repeat protein [Methylococcaceae bacterium]